MYDGEWKANKADGHGTIRFADGEEYDGEWKADKREGHGKYTFADGEVDHDGMWKDDEPAWGIPHARAAPNPVQDSRTSCGRG